MPWVFNPFTGNLDWTVLSTGLLGPPGADSIVPGPQGIQGETGEDSIVPGPQGEQGPAGSDATVTGTPPISVVAGAVSIREASNAQSGAATAVQIQALESAAAAQHAPGSDDQDLSGLVTKEAVSPDPSGYLPEYDGTGNLVKSTKLVSLVHSNVLDHAAVTVSTPLALTAQAVSIIFSKVELDYEGNLMPADGLTAIHLGGLLDVDSEGNFIPSEGTVPDIFLELDASDNIQPNV